MKSVSIILIWVFPALLIHWPGAGQNILRYNVTGRVYDAADHHPIRATIIFQALPDISEVYIDDSHETSGVYSIGVHRQNKYLVEVSAPNYKPEIDTLNIDQNLDSINYQLVSVKPGSVLRLQRIYFEQGDFQIQGNSFEELNELLLLLEQYPEMVVRLEGHTDRLGGRQANMVLSQNRVEEIKKYLIRHGIEEKRVKTQAFGGSRPISTENDEESRQINRRVEVRILSI
ncbi:MAG: OmpA family protein [Cyclobacteriaceae bacterium]|nr:OmpA family protein [Cyclobacteriaceae bacterium]